MHSTTIFLDILHKTSISDYFFYHFDAVVKICIFLCISIIYGYLKVFPDIAAYFSNPEVLGIPVILHLPYELTSPYL